MRHLTLAGRLGAGLAAVLALSLSIVPRASASSSTDPVAGKTWGIYEGNNDGLWPAYQQSTGRDHRLLGKMALHARVRWYGYWIETRYIASQITKDITQEQNGDPSVMVWMAIFRLWPGGESAGGQPMSLAAQQDYKDWINQAAQAIGSTPVGLILEPDLPLALGAASSAARIALVRYAAQTFSALPNTTVYIDGGASDWLSSSQLVSLLDRAGVQYARGFSLGATHHDSTAQEVRYGAAVAKGLAAHGIADKHFVVSTSDNGQPYSNKQFYEKYPRSQGYNSNNPPACTSKTEHVCVSLGIPPTTDVTNSRWLLPAPVAAMAARYCDAYVWIGNPWKINNDHDFNLQHALDAARTDPFF